MGCLAFWAAFDIGGLLYHPDSLSINGFLPTCDSLRDTGLLFVVGAFRVTGFLLDGDSLRMDGLLFIVGAL
jgi:hypothetical protein